MREPSPSKRARVPLVQVISVAVILLIGWLIVSAKVNAQPAASTQVRDGATPLSLDAGVAPATRSLDAAAAPVAAPSGADGGGDASAADDARVGKKAGGDKDKKDDDKPSPLDDAVVQTDEDFPKGATEEQKNAIGTGKVPIHREGPFRSPFASPGRGGPAHVKVGLVITDVRDYSIQSGGFEAEFFLSLTGDKPMPPITLDFTNGHEEDCRAQADTPTFKVYRCTGKFQSDVDLRKYPFDAQQLTIELEDAVYGVDALVFEADKNRTSLDEGFRLAGYGVASVGAYAYRHLYPPRFDRDDLYVSRYKFVLGIDRFANSAAFSVYVPAFIIVLISLFGLWVPPDELEVRTNAGAPMLAAAVLFHYSLIQGLPATGYLTRADKLMLGVYVSLLVNIASTWVFLLVKEEHVERAFRIARAWVPPLTIAIMILATLL